ncbi:hypothetical protein ACLWBD_08885 [Bdellovibrio sp. HCB117]|uniref:hypothetical protein n=1 Tax=Bdellovibrio TaxID=958 RepID=UPI000AE05B36|nr:hypothetical protein [Bdellovibrio bacteriovorus]
MKKLILLPLTLLAFIGCANSSDDSPGGEVLQGTESVVDEASAEERNIVDENMALIRDYAAQFSINVDWNKIPVVVSKTHLQRESSSCVRDANGVGTKIVLNKKFFSARVYDKETGYASPLYNLLIHEIGHCYMNRNHEEALLKKAGYRAQFVIDGKNGRQVVSYPSIQVSMMQNAFFQMPKVLMPYYVGEIFGAYRAKSLEDLQQRYEFDIVRASNFVEEAQ